MLQAVPIPIHILGTLIKLAFIIHLYIKINSKLSASINGGLGINTIIHGVQSINGEYLSLKNKKNFQEYL